MDRAPCNLFALPSDRFAIPVDFAGKSLPGPRKTMGQHLAYTVEEALNEGEVAFHA